MTSSVSLAPGTLYLASSCQYNTATQHSDYILLPLNTSFQYRTSLYFTLSRLFLHPQCILTTHFLNPPHLFYRSSIISSQSTQQQSSAFDESTKSVVPDTNSPAASSGTSVGSPGLHNDKMNSSGVVQRGSRLRNEGRW